MLVLIEAFKGQGHVTKPKVNSQGCCTTFCDIGVYGCDFQNVLIDLQIDNLQG